MISLRGSILHLILRWRKAIYAWDAPVEKFRAELKLRDRFIKLPHGVEVKPDRAEGIPIEWIIPRHESSQSIILYLHGGGWTLGWSNLHRRLVSYLCQAASSRALAVDYRLAPEHPFPAALEDCLIVYQWLLKNGTPPQNIVIAGDSAGGNLTLATLMALCDAVIPYPPRQCVFLR